MGHFLQHYWYWHCGGVGYQPKFAVGVVAGSSVLGMLIPPSLLMILYGFLSEQSVGDLFTAGIVPGLLMGLAIAVTWYWVSQRENVTPPPKAGGLARVAPAEEAAQDVEMAMWEAAPR